MRANAISQLAVFVGLILCSTLPAVPPGEPHVYKHVDGSDLTLYVTQPALPEDVASTVITPRPAIVFFHGGGWVGGVPGQFDEHAAYFASRGVVCFQVQYRLLAKNDTAPPETCVADAVSAMHWVREHCDEFGVDPARIASAGGSAGGHLAAYLGTIAATGEPPASDARANAMLLFNPVYDNGPGGWGTARVGERWQEFSPLHNLSENSPPSVVFLGTEDKLIPVATAEKFRDRSLELGVPSELYTYEGQPHGFFNVTRDGGKWYFETVFAADRFLSRLGWVDGPPTLTSPVAERVVLITLDGLRSEEVFGGGDRRLMIEELGAKNPEELVARYDRETATERREVLLPNLWRHVQDHGWIAGDIDRDSIVKVTNGKYFSYPGYSELLCGIADERIDSNAKKYNENQTVLEWLNAQEGFSGSVAAYCSWDVFPFIINDQRSGVPVNAGWSALTIGDPNRLAGLNFVANNLFHEWERVRYDAFTVSGAFEELQTRQPRVLYVSLGETDDWAHAGRYDRYLLTAQQNDFFIQQLWELIQSMEDYQGRTAFLIATDHGRGDGREGWKSHGSSLPGSERIWLAAFGAGVTARGNDEGHTYTQSQVAATVAALLGEDFNSSNPAIALPLPITRTAR
ncbi:alpha/beta hydrolase fold domain-containing protein [Aureliella helgolandensis]|nr:alpha/beta hydrolase fold domain-containing protein [Aureliella helgolandensis]